MLTKKAAYEFVEGGVHAYDVDFPGSITCGADLAEARRLLASALLDLAALALERGEPLPRPDPSLFDPDADIEEPIHLHLNTMPEPVEWNTSRRNQGCVAKRRRATFRVGRRGSDH